MVTVGYVVARVLSVGIRWLHLASLLDRWIGLTVAHLVVVRQAGVLVTSYEPIIHGLIARAFSLETGQRHELPLLNEKVAPVFTCEANLLKLVAHELALRVADALREGTLDVNGQPLWALDSCFHGCCSCWVIPQ